PAMTEQELRKLPLAIDLVTAGRALGMGRTKTHALVRAGEFPVEVLRIGNAYRVRTADLRRFLDVEPRARWPRTPTGCAPALPPPSPAPTSQSCSTSTSAPSRAPWTPARSRAFGSAAASSSRACPCSPCWRAAHRPMKAPDQCGTTPAV